MHPHHPCGMGPAYGMAPYYHPGMMGVFGGVINLTVAALRGGARIIGTVVEGSLWHAHSRCGGGCGHHEHGYHDCCELYSCHRGHSHCCCHMECVPPMYTGCDPCC